MFCRRHRFDSGFAVILFFCAAALFGQTEFAQGESPRELFEKGKAEFKTASYRSSLATFEKLDQVSRQPGLEQERVKLEPVIAFYRGVNLAALGEKEAAKKEFQAYLTFFPAADLDRAAFPKPAIQAFLKAREESQRQGHSQVAATAPDDRGIAATYARFRSPVGDPAPAIDERWAAGPVRYFLTKSEKIAWERITDPVERVEFISKFWQERDPDPLTTENEFRQEFEKRVQFSDVYFAVEEKKGSETDRGLVFTLLGPPSYIGETPLTSQDDPIQVARAAPERETTIDRRGRLVVNYTSRPPLTSQVFQGTRETWHYRRDRLPRSVKFNEVNFEFITKEGYGVGILQRDYRVLATLDEAAKSAERTAK